MSTKTTYKRIALVAVAAMGFGLLSVAPSSATSQSDTLTLSAATKTCEIGTACTVLLTQTMLSVQSDTMSVTAALTSNGNAESVAMPILTDNIGARTCQVAGNATYPVISTDALTGLLIDTGSASTYHSCSATWTVSYTATHSGTYVVTFTAYNMTGGATRSTVTPQAASKTLTITVDAGTVADTTSKSIRSKGIVASGSTSTDQSVVVAANTGSAVAIIVVTPLTESAASTGSTTTTAVLTGPGTLTINSSAATAAPLARTVTRTGTGASYVFLYGDGTTGTSTITITMGVNTFTETVTFYGAAASVTSTLLVPVIHSGSGAVSTGSVISATVKDAAGNVVPGVTVYAVSGTTTAMASASATTGSAGVAYFSFTGLVAGTSAITVQNVASGSTVTYSAAALSVRAGDKVGTSVVLTLDKTTYEQGAAAILTVTVKDAAGNPVSNGTNTVFDAAVVCSRACTGTLPGVSHVTTGSHLGAITYAFNVPSTSGSFTLSAVDAISASAGSTVSVTATVNSSAAEVAAVAAAATNAAATAAAIAAAAEIAAAAVDAAAEATDAANAATDAANAAAEAADAATAAAQDAADAVAALSAAVTELMAELKAQIAAQKAAITALTNLVIKIQKKIKA